jgi:hypothetical protein
MAALTCIVLPAALFVEINSLMRILLKSVEDILVTGLTGFRADIGLWASRGGRSLRLSGGRFRLLCWRLLLFRLRLRRFLLLISGIRQSGK